MSEASKAINNMIESKLLNLHTAYFAKVIEVYDTTAKIQPLNLIKASGKSAQYQATLTVPILRTVLEADTISSGDTVFCLCGERDITETKKGNYAVPNAGHHRISDSVIIGAIDTEGS